ncbi:efflux RND transporter periplasmic adaptor subunit [Albimonas pacifica]|uniref:RND family efflux transporter, MFP subunit n=1 Tax=Albimonas pacifica TaxID=1114924 RepID=A0A1I3FRA7_9RHOB|nr:efflux RND transporter periplasmic adaptor subunit [Albimonas pacifica]SFI13755.1 RND family efflux transporter, MFP subunit [Albimonas pacifica]
MTPPTTSRPALALLLAAALTAPAAAPAQTQAPPVVTVAQPVVRDIIEDDEFIGRFEAAEAVEVRARVSGYLEQVHFEDGQRVTAGDPLFTIDQRLFRTYLAQAEARVEAAEAAYAFADDQLGRAQSLVRNGNISQASVDERMERRIAAMGDLEHARQAVEQARIDLEFSRVTAPISGRIDRKRVTPGNLVRENETVLTTIVATDPIHFYFDIDERYFLAYARDARARGESLQEGGGGLKVRVTLSDRNIEPRDGVLDFSENRIDPRTGTMRMRAVLANPDGVLTPGLFGRVNVPGSLPHPGVLIPDAAVVADQDRRMVMTVQEDGTVAPRLVRPGPRIDGYRVIREGLDGSETIVVEGLLRARPGMKVTPEAVTLPPVAGQEG